MGLLTIIITMKYQILTHIFFLFKVSSAFFKYPWHASCKIEWEFSHSCQDVQNKIEEQINLWQGDSLCPGTSPSCPDLPCGQNCLYQLTSSSSGQVKRCLSFLIIDF